MKSFVFTALIAIAIFTQSHAKSLHRRNNNCGGSPNFNYYAITSTVTVDSNACTTQICYDVEINCNKQVDGKTGGGCCKDISHIDFPTPAQACVSAYTTTVSGSSSDWEFYTGSRNDSSDTSEYIKFDKSQPAQSTHTYCITYSGNVQIVKSDYAIVGLHTIRIKAGNDPLDGAYMYGDYDIVDPSQGCGECPKSEPTCGDGVVEGTEECDDGNAVNTDGCTNQCTLPVCGDSIVQTGEECDDGNTANNDGCSSSCKNEVCGDGITQTGEECDDGNTANNDGCSSACKTESCGDGTVQTGEECDDGNTTDGDGCSATCTVEPSCGDGNVDAGEECDDGNTANNDGCSSSCKNEVCGDGITQTGEECDDGNTANNDGCSSACKTESCGDGTVQTGEECDDGNTTDGDGCSATCTVEPSCGDGNVDAGEECDDGNTANNDGCSSSCKNEVCGDGITSNR